MHYSAVTCFLRNLPTIHLSFTVGLTDNAVAVVKGLMALVDGLVGRET